MPNTVQVDFVGNPQAFFRVADQVRAESEKVAKSQIDAAKSAATLQAAIAKQERAVEQAKQATLGTQLKQLQVDKAQLSVQEQLAKQARASQGVTTRIDKTVTSGMANIQKDIQKTLSKDLREEEARRAAEVAAINRQTVVNAKRNADVLTKITRDRVNAELAIEKSLERSAARGFTSTKGADGLRTGPSAGEQRYGRINLARQGADVFTQAGSGASPALIAIQQGPQIIEAVAQAGLKVSTVAVTAASAVGLVGAAVIAYSAIAVKESERRLKTEEKLSIEYGRQQKALFEINQQQFAFAKARENASADRSFTERLNAGNPLLMGVERKKLEEQLRQSQFYGGAAQVQGRETPATKAFRESFEQGLQSRIQQLDERLAKPNAALFERADRSFVEFQQRQRDEAKAAFDERQDKLVQSLSEKAADPKRSLNELRGLRTEARQIVDPRKSADFIKSIDKAIEESVERGVEMVKGLGDQYRDQFSRLRGDLNRENPFVRIWQESDSALASLRKNLAGASPELLKAGEAMQNRITGKELFGARLDNKLDAFSLRNRGEDFRNAGTDEILERQSPEFAAFLKQQRTQNRVSDQLAILNKPDLDKDERSIADARLTSFASSLDPRTLNFDQRNAIADAFDRRAVETERREIESLKEARETNRLLGLITKDEKALQNVAKNGGSRAIEVILKNESNQAASARVVKSATPDDTSKRYDPDLLYGGPGGFTNLGN